VWRIGARLAGRGGIPWEAADDARRRRALEADPAMEGMSIVPEDEPPPAKPKLSAEERQRRWEERLAALRLRMAIGRELDERGIAEPAAIGAALGMPAVEATKLLNRHRWHEGDVALLAAAAARLGLPTDAASTRGRGGEDDPQRPS
jgi:hypothetical protein